MNHGEANYYYLTDAQGSVVGLTTAAGAKVNTYAYDPYGNARTTTEAVPNPLRYTSAHLDATGLYKMGARYYDPTVGRFTQRDPAGQEANAYAYASGDPINRADPTGLVSDFISTSVHTARSAVGWGRRSDSLSAALPGAGIGAAGGFVVGASIEFGKALPDIDNVF